MLSTKDNEIAQLRTSLQAAVAAATAHNNSIAQLRAAHINEIAQLRGALAAASESATARENEFTRLHEQLRSAEQALKQEMQRCEDIRRIYTVHGNTQHFSRLRVEELSKENEKLEEEKTELQKWVDREKGAKAELEELKRRLYELSTTPGV